jgi:dipeptidyl-peptidase-4
MKSKSILFVVALLLVSTVFFAQNKDIKWSSDGNSYFTLVKNEIIRNILPDGNTQKVLTSEQLTPVNSKNSLKIGFFSFSSEEQKVLIFTNTKKVWRLNTRGDYWLYDFKEKKLQQLGKTLPTASMMFAKLSPDGNFAAYVSSNNIYVENLLTGKIKQLTNDGNTTIINGTFDWVYEEEFFCRDGFRWSPDSKSIAYWQIDASDIRKFYMINNTDSIYSQIVPVEYPKAGKDPSKCKIGVVNIDNAMTKWMNIPGDIQQNYIVRLEFIPKTNDLLVQQLNRKQNESNLYVVDSKTGVSKSFFKETSDAWVDLYQPGNTYTIDYTNNFIWYQQNKGILWASEKDGWRHFYHLDFNKTGDKLITSGNYDVLELKHIDEKNDYLYFLASPENATQKYLYKCRLKDGGKEMLVSPKELKGTHEYNFSANGKYAMHKFSNHYTTSSMEILEMPEHKPINEKESIINRLSKLEEKTNIEFFNIKTSEGVEMDAWMIKPYDFDPQKKYPVVFYVYTEPGSATVEDSYGSCQNFLYAGDMAEDGYIQISMDNRGTPVPKGREWRKSIYRKIGQLNIHDQAFGAKEILKWNFIDRERVAVWGWSGGGSATLNLMFQHPQIYKTGISIAPLTDLRLYDNIYQERYMGLPQENAEDYKAGSAVTYADNLEGNLLLIHGTGDDNVHYQNSEMLINALVKSGKIFQFMPYPNRTHNISEGQGTFEHLVKLYTTYIREKCPPGGR